MMKSREKSMSREKNKKKIDPKIFMTKILKLTHLIYDYRMTKMQIWGSRVESYLDSKRPTFIQSRYQFLLWDNFLSASAKFCHYTIYRFLGHGNIPPVAAARGNQILPQWRSTDVPALPHHVHPSNLITEKQLSPTPPYSLPTSS